MVLVQVGIEARYMHFDEFQDEAVSPASKVVRTRYTRVTLALLLEETGELPGSKTAHDTTRHDEVPGTKDAVITS